MARSTSDCSRHLQLGHLCFLLLIWLLRVHDGVEVMLPYVMGLDESHLIAKAESVTEVLRWRYDVC
jgi:hypothetical protein